MAVSTVALSKDRREQGTKEAYLSRDSNGCCAAEGHQKAKGLAKVVHRGGVV